MNQCESNVDEWNFSVARDKLCFISDYVSKTNAGKFEECEYETLLILLFNFAHSFCARSIKIELTNDDVCSTILNGYYQYTQ